MSSLFNRVRVNTTTTGTGTITLGGATSDAFFTFAEASVANATVVSYVIEDGTDVEFGIGTYTVSGTTLSRDTVTASKIGGTAGTSKINLSGTAIVFIDSLAGDLPHVGTPTEGAPAAGDFVPLMGAEGDMRKVNWSSLPGAGGGISNVVEDTSPTLGGDLDGGAFDITNVDQLFINSTSSLSPFVATRMQIAVGEQWAYSAAAFRANAFGGDILFLKSRNATPGSHTIVQNGDTIGSFAFYGDDGVDYESEAAHISVVVDGSPGAGDMPGRMVFATTADSQQTATDRMIITSAGVVRPGADDGGSLGAAGAAWSDLFLAEGGVINWDSGDLTMTQTGNSLALAGGTLTGASVDTATDTTTGVVEIAVQTEMEAGSDTARAVTPGRQHFHPSAAKFWVYWTANSTTILKSYNTTSIADTAVGDADITIGTDFSDANWAGFVSTNDSSANGWDSDSIQSSGFNARAAGTTGVLCGQMIDGTTAVGNLIDPQQWQVVGFGDL